MLFQSLLLVSKKRKQREEEEFEDLCSSLESDEMVVDTDDDNDMVRAISYATVIIATANRRHGAPRGPALDREQNKGTWSNGYRTWDAANFKARVRVTRETFNFLLGEITASIEKTPTNLCLSKLFKLSSRKPLF